jgi:hypothetical protein
MLKFSKGSLGRQEEGANLGKAWKSTHPDKNYPNRWHRQVKWNKKKEYVKREAIKGVQANGLGSYRMDLPGPTTSVGTRTDYSVGPWDYPSCATRHLKAWSTRTT